MNAVDVMLVVLEITYLAGIALWPLLVILFLFVAQHYYLSEKKVVEVALAAFFLYTFLGCLSWLGQLVDIARYLIWSVAYEKEWWWVFKIIGNTSPWSIGPREIRATIAGAVLFVVCAGFMWWVLHDDKPLYG